MTDLVLAFVLLAAAAGAAWLLADLRTVPLPPARPVEPAPPGRPTGGRPQVSVVIPARDEAATLPEVLRCLRVSEVVAEVVVVDDGSRDETAALARAGGAVVVPAGAPPAGWTGKAWACGVGARSTGGELLLFLDADTMLAPAALRGLLDVRARHGGLVSVQPYHAVERPYEQLSAYFNAVALLASGAFARRPGRPGRAMAFGPCLVTSRADYERVGGHATVRADVLDDVRLAAAYERAGLPVRCLAGGVGARMRSYPGGLRQLMAGWTKNVASGAGATARGPLLGAVLWLSAHHAAAVGAVLAVVAATTGWGASLSYGSGLLWAAGWLLAAAQLRWVLRRAGSFRWWTWMLFPVPLAVFDVVFARSLVRTVVHRSVRWRGREVDLRGRGPAEDGA